MKTCDCCAAIKNTKDFCDTTCKMRYYRGTKNNPVTVEARIKKYVNIIPVTPKAQDNVTVPEEAQEEYITPTAPCAFCGKTLTYDDEIEGFPCKKCKQVTRTNIEH